MASILDGFCALLLALTIFLLVIGIFIWVLLGIDVVIYYVLIILLISLIWYGISWSSPTYYVPRTQC